MRYVIKPITEMKDDIIDSLFLASLLNTLSATLWLLFHSGLETECDLHLLGGVVQIELGYDSSSSYISIVTSQQRDKA